MKFQDFFEENTGHYLLSVEDPFATIQDYYPDYFEGKSVIREKILQEKELSPKKKGRKNKSLEVIRNLFFPRYKVQDNHLTDLLHTEYLKEIQEKHGEHIWAHGVEEAKGGMTSLISMCIHQKVFAPAESWGPLMDGPPNASPLPHGPYYIISNSNNEKNAHNPSINEIEAILVPFPELITELKFQLQKAVGYNLITSEIKDAFIDKCIDYQSYYNKLEQNRENVNQVNRRTF